MKKLLLVGLTIGLVQSEAMSKEIRWTIPDSEVAIVENDVIDAEQWIKEAWAGKVSKCKSRIIKAETAISIKGNETLPAGEDAIVNKYFSRPDYKKRKDREPGEKGKVTQ